MLRAESLRKVYHPPRSAPVVAVSNATFSVGEGEVLGLLGPNGAGKTTLLRILGGIIAPTSGHCFINDTDLAAAGDAMRRDIGFLSGNTKLYARLTPRELLRYFGRLYAMNETLIRQRTEEFAQLLSMSAFMDRRCESLSTGQTQKVNIARTMLHAPKLLILDEPTLGLDIMSSRSIIEFIHNARTRGHCVLFSTHHMSEAERLCDRIALIHRGELLAVDTLPGIFARTATNALDQAFLALAGGNEA